VPIVLFLLFIAVPVVELAVILQVGDLLGLWPTIALLFVVSILGAWLVRREGTRAWWAFRAALSHGRVPTREVIDGALLLLGGALLLTPGFVTDLTGLLLVLPPTRAVVNRIVRSRVRATAVTVASGRVSGVGRGRPGPRPPRGQTVDAEVVDVRRESPGPRG
jgi:UPF0716 protein FxsA